MSETQRGILERGDGQKFLELRMYEVHVWQKLNTIEC